MPSLYKRLRNALRARCKRSSERDSKASLLVEDDYSSTCVTSASTSTTGTDRIFGAPLRRARARENTGSSPAQCHHEARIDSPSTSNFGTEDSRVSQSPDRDLEDNRPPLEGGQQSGLGVPTVDNVTKRESHCSNRPASIHLVRANEMTPEWYGERLSVERCRLRGVRIPRSSFSL